MVVGKLLILTTSTAVASDIRDPRFFEYQSGGIVNNIFNLSFGWFKKLDSEQKLMHSQALMHAVSYAENGESVKWYKNDASGLVVPSMTWPSGNGYCRRVYVEAIAHGVKKTARATACYDSAMEKWTWHEGK
jgi:surface antigen